MIEEYRSGGAFKAQVVWQLHGQNAGNSGGVLLLSKETMHRMWKNMGQPVNIILNSSNSRYLGYILLST